MTNYVHFAKNASKVKNESVGCTKNLGLDGMVVFKVVDAVSAPALAPGVGALDLAAFHGSGLAQGGPPRHHTSRQMGPLLPELFLLRLLAAFLRMLQTSSLLKFNSFMSPSPPFLWSCQALCTPVSSSQVTLGQYHFLPPTAILRWLLFC